ncbi:MAG: hypothetical protein K2J80_14575 [Oscillospiraceae bacterium]|nr:hypothetical protein [Oscillospiraceae bacterium]
MITSFGKFKLDVDTDKTREYYKTAELITKGCTCDGCTNFEKAADVFPKPVKELFGDLGIDPKKAADVFTCCSENNGAKLYYIGCYVFFGKILAGERIKLFEKVDENTSVGRLREDRLFKADEDYYVGFEPNGDSVETALMEVHFHVPWVLDKPNTYK